MEDTPDKKESQSETAEENYYKRIRTAFAKRRDEIKKSCYSIRIRFLVDYLKNTIRSYVMKKLSGCCLTVNARQLSNRT